MESRSTDGVNYNKNNSSGNTKVQLAVSSGISLGLAGFGFAVLHESMITIYSLIRNLDYTVDGMAAQGFFVGGLGQVIAGIICYLELDNFHATAFTSFGLNWMGKGLNYYLANYGNSSNKESSAAQRGILSMGWSIWVGILLASKLKSRFATLIMLIGLNVFVDIETLALWISNTPLKIIASVVGIFTALMAFYNAATNMISIEDSGFVLPRGRVIFGNTSQHHSMA
ncbi:hypothetical protein BB561_000512 [Smittium simulii]|uniref:Uncharacterized protein n=1 Tax=Smittium simulii TaxID=133385 RepID=A0A2T9YYU2_9FUNG|nr:hypothetical protein BB561_000512 [Smittium simulii]